MGDGSLPAGAGPLAWVRCGVEFLPVAIAISSVLSLSVFSLCFLFPSFPQLYPASLYSEFRLYPSGLHNNARCVKLRHDLVCITMPVA